MEIQLQAEPEHNRVRIESLCRLTGKTGVEMEALTRGVRRGVNHLRHVQKRYKRYSSGPVRLLAKAAANPGDF